MTLIYITNPSRKEAGKIADMLLEKRLIGCANIFPITSKYWWKGKIANEKEFALIGKTTDNKYNKIKKEVEKVHSYSIPCIMKINAESNEKFSKWLKKELLKIK